MVDVVVGAGVVEVVVGVGVVEVLVGVAVVLMPEPESHSQVI